MQKGFLEVVSTLWIVLKIIDACNEETECLKNNGQMAMTLYECLHQSPRNVVQEDYYGNMLNGPNFDKVLKS